VLDNRPDDPKPIFTTHASPPRKSQPRGNPEIKIVDTPGPRVNRRAPTETAELAGPCFAAGVIVSPSGEYEDSAEEQVTDSSEISCRGSFSSPVTFSMVASAR
jgi:hypothetical protein